MDESIREEILSKTGEIPIWILLASLVLFAIGILTFIMRAISPQPSEAWRIFHVNFLFWTGLAQGGIIFSCVLRIAQARWARPLIRVSEAMGSFIPISFILLIVFFIGQEYTLPYATEHYHAPKEIWLDMSFVMARDIIGFFILMVVGFSYLYFSLRQDLGGVGHKLSGINGWIASGWSGEEDRDRCWERIRILGPATVLIYVAVFSFFAWDFMMSLDPYWFSTLFGPFYSIGSFVAAMAGTIVLSIMIRNRLRLEQYIADFQYHDMGKLLLGFSIFWVYLMYSQLLPIWYANLPEEIGFVIARLRTEPFQTLSWVVLSCCFIFPFIALLPRTTKIVKPVVAFIAAVSLSGFWLEKYLLVVPSFTDSFHFGLTGLGITAGFLGGFLFTFALFMRTFPSIPVGDRLFGGKVVKDTGGHGH